MAYPGGVWRLAWSLTYFNCSPPEPPYQDFLYLNSATTFTVSPSRQAPNLTAATSPQMCGTTNGVAINATSFGLHCGVLAPQKATPTPCAATINSAAVSNIYADATESACFKPQACQQNPDDTCPTSTGTPSASPGAADRMAAASTLLVFLTMCTVFISICSAASNMPL